MGQNSRSRSPQGPVLPPVLAASLRGPLRQVREALHRGRDLAGEALDRAPLPPPVGHLARGVLSGLDEVAGRVEGIASDLAHDLLGDARPATQDRAFGALAAEALSHAVDHLGITAVALDPEAAARVHAAWRTGPTAGAGLGALHAALAERALRPAGTDAGTAVALFAVLLWSEVGRPDDRATLLACCDLAAAIAPEITAAANLTSLFREFRDHV